MLITDSRTYRSAGRAGAVVLVGFLVVSAWSNVCAQAPGVEIVRDKGEQFKMLVEKANKLKDVKALMSLDDVAKQMDRKKCKISLPAPKDVKMSDRQIWQLSKDAHVRVGWHYKCKNCDKWHQNLAGGYFINEDGVVATCHHVIDKDEGSYEEGYLVVADDTGDLLPVLEILASDDVTDTAIIRVKTKGKVTALPLNPNTYPGDTAYCFSDPLGRSEYFSKGIVNRFYVYKKKGKQESARMEVSTDWAPGSSGAAVLDAFGNAIGHVSEISSAGTKRRQPIIVSNGKDGETNKISRVIGHQGQESVIVFHCASRAADVLSLVEK